MELRESKIELLRKMTQELNSRDKELYLYKKFLDSLPIGIYVTDIKCETYYYNEKAFEILGNMSYKLGHDSSDKFHIYKSGTDILYPIEEYPNIVTLKTGEEVWVEDMDIIRPDGRYKLCFRSIPIKSFDELEYVVSTFYLIKWNN